MKQEQKQSGMSNVAMTFKFNGKKYVYVPSGDDKALAVVKDGLWTFFYDVESVNTEFFAPAVFFHEHGTPECVEVTATFVEK